jgi:hypothetical protein
MKHSKLILTFLMTLLATGCGKSSTDNDATATPPAAPTTQPSTPIATPAVAQPASTGATAAPMQLIVAQQPKLLPTDLKDYTYAEKDDYLKAMQVGIDELHLDLVQFSAKIEHTSDATKAAAKPRLDALQLQLTKLGIELGDAKNATESIWGDAKIKVQRASDETRQTFRDVGQWIEQQPTA